MLDFERRVSYTKGSEVLTQIAELYGLQLGLEGTSYTLKPGPKTVRALPRMVQDGGLISAFAFREPLSAVLKTLFEPFADLQPMAAASVADLPVTFYFEYLCPREALYRIARMYGLTVTPEFELQR